MKRILLPVFPGTNCERESRDWLNDNLEVKAEFLDLETHESLTSKEIAAVLIPGGFSYGDYLRAGALAARSPEMKYIGFLANQGVAVLGICNGFQILCEAGLLPGVLTRNETKQHHHFPVALRLNSKPISCAWIDFESSPKDFFELPMSCGMGKFLPPAFLSQSEEQTFLETQCPLFYVNNENGSYKAVAAVCSKDGNVVGMMPHPERASETILGSDVGLFILASLAKSGGLTIRKNSALESHLTRLNLK